MTPPAPARPVLLGLATGMRSQLGLAALAWSRPAGRGDPAPLRGLRSRAGRVAVTAAAVGELVADKLPRTPSRTQPPALAGRLVIGALVGALAAGSTDRRAVLLAGAAGAAGAAAGTYAGAAYRTALPARTHTPDLPWALVEDAVAASLAATAVTAWPDRQPWWRRVPLPRR